MRLHSKVFQELSYRCREYLEDRAQVLGGIEGDFVAGQQLCGANSGYGGVAAP